MKRRIEIFRTGKHTASSGEVIDFTAPMVRAIAAAYDPAKYDAPLVIGHPQTNDPAYGWTRALEFSADTLAAEPRDVEPQFAAMVNGQRFPRISASFFLPNSPDNPVPGVYYLRHVGFLGAAAPSVQGLKPASFAAGETGIVEFTADWQGRTDQVIPDWQITTLESEPSATSYAAPAPQLEVDMDRAEIERREKALKDAQDKLAADQVAFAARETQIRGAETAARRIEIASFVDGLVKAGKVLPVHQAGLVAYMAGPNDAGVIEFAAAEAGKPNLTAKPEAWLRQFLAELPQAVDYTERSAPERDAGRGAISFAAPQGYSVDPERLALHARALAHQKAHPGTTYDAALAAVMQ